jgi:hypothetical protein
MYLMSTFVDLTEQLAGDAKATSRATSIGGMVGIYGDKAIIKVIVTSPSRAQVHHDIGFQHSLRTKRCSNVF